MSTTHSPPKPQIASAPSGALLVHVGNRPTEVAAFEVAMVSFFVDAADLLGIPKSVAAIYGLCFANVEPMSFADLDERLEISTGSISQGVRVLREVGALKVSGSHDRREYFTPDVELRQLVSRFIEQRLEKQLKAGKSRLNAMKTVLPSGKTRAELKARLKYLHSWHDQSKALLPVIKTFLKLT